MITGKRIYLRGWEKSDVPTFLRWFNDPEVTIYLSNPYPAGSTEQEEHFVSHPREGEQRYCIVTREGDVPIGNCGIFDVNARNRSCEVGIAIGEKAYWNQGYGREVLALLQEIAFEGMGMNRVTLRHTDFNERGHRCYLAAGFVEEGRLRQSEWVKGSFHADVIMSVLAEEYFARKSA
jgi:diamine N-acetyltransferase